MTAESQNRAVALRNVDVLAAAKTDRHVAAPAVWPASSNSPCLDDDLFNYSILGVVWNGASQIRRASMPQDQSAGASERYGWGAIGRGNSACALLVRLIEQLLSQEAADLRGAASYFPANTSLADAWAIS